MTKDAGAIEALNYIGEAIETIARGSKDGHWHSQAEIHGKYINDASSEVADGAHEIAESLYRIASAMETFNQLFETAGKVLLKHFDITVQ